MMELFEAAVATGGTAFHGSPAFTRVVTDSRMIATGDLFVALRGERFDGHDFVIKAASQGAVAALVDAEWAQQHPLSSPYLAVADTRLALGALAAYWRAKFELPLVGITGSNGKTSVKEMISAILRAQALAEGFDPLLAVLATEGNLNNDIGVPLMLLKLNLMQRVAVIEMGMNHPGEIAYLTGLAKPTVALVTNAQRAHLQGLESLANVAREKGAIYAGLGANGIAIINADDAFANDWRELNRERQIVTFGLEASADVSARFETHGWETALHITTRQAGMENLIEATLKTPGLHNVRNALAATAAALAVGATPAAVASGLNAYRGFDGRLQIRSAINGATLIDDSYNANPDSARAAIDVLAATAGRKILVLGDMGEIGEQSGQFHDEIGGYAKSEGVDLLYALGEYAELAARNFGPGGSHYTNVEALTAALLPQLGADTVALVKGSRFMRMERVCDAIAQNGDANAA